MRSIKQDLSFGLIIITIVVCFIAGAVNTYYFVSRDTEIIEKNFSQDVQDLSQILGVHLWTFNEEALQHICNARLVDEHVLGIQVVNDLQKVVFSKPDSIPFSKYKKSKDIIYNNHTVGKLEITFDSSSIQQRIWDTLLVTSTIVLLLCGSAITLIHLLLKKYFTTPVNALLHDINLLGKGKYHEVQFSARRVEVGKIIDAFNTLSKDLAVRDMEIQERSVSLKNAKEEWEKTFNAITDIITIQDKDMKIMHANQAAYDFFKTQSPELVGKYCYEVFRGSSEPCAGCPQIDTLRDAGNYSAIVEHEKLEKIFNVSSSPILDQNNEIQYLVHIAKDVTEHKKMEAELFQSHKMEAIGTLAGGIAHDFNNILAAILGYADMARDDIPEASPTRKYIDQVLKAGYRAKELVKQILTFSHKSQETQQSLQPSLIIKEAMKLLRASIPSTIEIQEDIDSDCGFISANPTNIHQILVNLCTNALHAMEDEHGVLKISLSRVKASEVKDAGGIDLSGDKFVKIMVSDTGQGMDKETLVRVFEPYFTTKEVGKGSGMGLALVHGIVQRSGGVIRAESELASGTTISIYFPRIEVSEVSAGEEKTLDLPKGNESILVIDDEETIVSMYQDTLEKLGYSVTATISSTKALEDFMESPDSFDLVITDQTMPHLSGSELAQKILDIRSPFPIILCTGYSNTISEQNAEDLGIEKYLEKPVSRQRLAMDVRDVLDEYKSQTI